MVIADQKALIGTGDTLEVSCCLPENFEAHEIPLDVGEMAGEFWV